VIDRVAKSTKAWAAAIVAGAVALELATTTDSAAGMGVTKEEWYRVLAAVVIAGLGTYNVANREP